MNYNKVLLLLLNEPEYLRLELLRNKQKESSLSETVFCEKLKNSWNFFNTIIENKIIEKNALKISILDYKIPLLPKSKMRLISHLGKYELNLLHTEIMKYQNSILKETFMSKENIYSIYSIMIKFKTQNNELKMILRDLRDFNLYNENIYDFQGNLTSEAECPKEYDFSFAKSLSMMPIHKCKDFLKHHFDFTNNKKEYLMHLKYNILLYSFIKVEQVEFVKNWIKEITGDTKFN